MEDSGYYHGYPLLPHPERNEGVPGETSAHSPSLNNRFSVHHWELPTHDEMTSVTTGNDNSEVSHHSGPPPTLALEDDKQLIKNVDRFLRGEIHQETFEAEYCTRLLFTWHWILNLCFCNRKQALQVWYQLLSQVDEDDIWLWVDGDEGCGPVYLLVEPSDELNSAFVLSRFELGHAVRILNQRFQSRSSTSRGEITNAFDPQPRWRHRLGTCSKPYLRYAAVLFVIATSDMIRQSNGDRNIKDMHCSSLLIPFAFQYYSIDEKKPSILDSQVPHRQEYVSNLEGRGHTCFHNDNDGLEGLLLEIIDVFGSDEQFRVPDWPLHIKSSCEGCKGQRGLIFSDISWSYRRTKNTQEKTVLSSYKPRDFLRLLWWMWVRTSYQRSLMAQTCSARSFAEDGIIEWLKWLGLLARYSASSSQNSVDNYEGFQGPTLIIRHLLSHQMEEWIQSACWKYEIKEVDTSSPIIYDLADIADGVNGHHEHILLSRDWKAAEEIFSDPIAAWYGNNEPVDVRSVFGVLLTWTSARDISMRLPDIHTFIDSAKILPESVYTDCERAPPPFQQEQRESRVHKELKLKVQKDRPKCCPEYTAEIVDWYLSCATLLDPRSSFSTELIWRCRCRGIDDEEAFRVFKASLSRDGSDPRDLLDRMIDAAVQAGLDPSTLKRRKSAPKKSQSESINQSDSESEADEEPANHPALHPEALTTTQLTTYAQALSKEPAKRAAQGPPTLPASVSPRAKVNNVGKSSQVEHIRKYLLDLLKDLESSTRQIHELIPRGKQRESSLPWKSLLQILRDRGYELENWPLEVPLPGSGSGLCDDNKGIHGLNARHLRLLYNATQDKENPLRFRKVDGGASARVQSEDTGRRGVTRRRDEEDVEEDGGVELAGPSKRSRVDPPRAGPSRVA